MLFFKKKAKDKVRAQVQQPVDDESASENFYIKNYSSIEKHESNIVDYRVAARDETDLDKKIELLQKCLQEYDKMSDWAKSRGNGGIAYISTTWEHIHNSSNDDFSYRGTTQAELDEAVYLRDIVMPYLLSLKGSGTLQKDIYSKIPDAPKGKVQWLVQRLVDEGELTREKSGSTYIIR